MKLNLKSNMRAFNIYLIVNKGLIFKKVNFFFNFFRAHISKHVIAKAFQKCFFFFADLILVVFLV